MTNVSRTVAGRLPANLRHRPGGVLMVALICLVITSIITGSLLKIALANRKQLRQEQFRLQADWLVESAISRAASRLAADAKYAGETWNISAGELGGNHTGRVAIVVATPTTNATHKLVKVVAEYPAESELPVRRTKSIAVEMGISP